MLAAARRLHLPLKPDRVQLLGCTDTRGSKPRGPEPWEEPPWQSETSAQPILACFELFGGREGQASITDLFCSLPLSEGVFLSFGLSGFAHLRTMGAMGPFITLTF